MRTEWTDSGWKEIVTKQIAVQEIGRRPLMTVSKWLDFNKRFPKLGRRRSKCDSCKVSWDQLSGQVHIVFTDKGNKSVCDGCVTEMKERGIV